jgi:hypothetical protein
MQEALHQVGTEQGVAGPQSQVLGRPPERAESPSRNRPPEPQPGVFLVQADYGLHRAARHAGDVPNRRGSDERSDEQDGCAHLQRTVVAGDELRAWVSVANSSNEPVSSTIPPAISQRTTRG